MAKIIEQINAWRKVRVYKWISSHAVLCYSAVPWSSQLSLGTHGFASLHITEVNEYQAQQEHLSPSLVLQADFVGLPLFPMLVTASTVPSIEHSYNYTSPYPSQASFTWAFQGGMTGIPCGDRTIHIEYTTPIQGECRMPLAQHC